MVEQEADEGAGLRLSTVAIRNFRGIRDLTVDIDRVTVLVGENNTGKTAFLEAIRICLDHNRWQGRPFEEYDYHLTGTSSTPSTAEPIEIVLTFRENQARPWNKEISRRLTPVITSGNDKQNQIICKFTSNYEATTGNSLRTVSFLNIDGEEISRPASVQTHLSSLRFLCRAYYLSAIRDAARHFGSKSRYWQAFLSEESIPEAERQKFETEFAQLNDSLVKSHGSLQKVRSHLDLIGDIIEVGGSKAVDIEALPSKLFSLLARSQVIITSKAGARVPIDKQGEGMQSLAVLLLFDAFLRSRVNDQNLTSEPIIALEEPEAHLHPSAVRTLARVITELPGQVLMSTHSGDLLSAVEVTAIRRFAFRDGGVKVFGFVKDVLSEEEMRKFDSHLRRTRGELLYARCWLLVEGETDTILYNGAADALGFDLDRRGVRCVEYRQTGIEVLVRVASGLGIECYMVADTDAQGDKDASAARSILGDTEDGERIVLPYNSPEEMLYSSGFTSMYREITEKKVQKSTSSESSEGDVEEKVKVVPSGGLGKPGAAHKAVQEMQLDPQRVPKCVVNIIEEAISLGRAGS